MWFWDSKSPADPVDLGWWSMGRYSAKPAIRTAMKKGKEAVNSKTEEAPIIEQTINIIGPTLADCIGGGESSHDAYRWVKEGVEPALGRRMQPALKVLRIICHWESELKA
jgi:hypothetical protein